MLAVIFELKAKEGTQDTYFELTSQLKPMLKEVDGFISIERFESLAEPGKYLSLSFWRDEKAIEQWRNIEAHRLAQQQGREKIFQYYRLRVAQILRDYDSGQSEQRPADSALRHATQS